MAERRLLNVVALETLTKRLNEVFKWLARVHERSEDDVESVHKLRVSTRRAVEALRAFKGALGRRSARDLRKKLKRLRRAADQARDADVFIERLNKNPDELGHAALMQLARAHRDEAQPELLAVQRQAKDEIWKTQAKTALARLRDRKQEKGQPKFKRAARRFLRKTLKKFIKASHGNFEKDAELHRFRVSTKRLRYAIEIVKSAFPATLGGPLYTQIESWQDRLGDINDRAAAINMLTTWAEQSATVATREALEKRIELERDEQRVLRAMFLIDVTPRTIKTLKARLKRLLK